MLEPQLSITSLIIWQGSQKRNPINFYVVKCVINVLNNNVPGQNQPAKDDIRLKIARRGIIKGVDQYSAQPPWASSL